MSNTDSSTGPLCRECNAELPEGRKRGRCRDCKLAARKRYRQKNQELIKARTRAYYEANRAKVRTSQRAYYEANAEQERARNAKYREENAQAIRDAKRIYAESGRDRERRRQWFANNPEKKRAYELNRKARLAGAKGSHTPDELFQMYEDQQGLCAYCETPMFGNYSVDHMLPISRGGSNDWSNLAIVCVSCNSRKAAKTVEEFVS